MKQCMSIFAFIAMIASASVSDVVAMDRYVVPISRIGNKRIEFSIQFCVGNNSGSSISVIKIAENPASVGSSADLEQGESTCFPIIYGITQGSIYKKNHETIHFSVKFSPIEGTFDEGTLNIYVNDTLVSSHKISRTMNSKTMLDIEPHMFKAKVEEID